MSGFLGLPLAEFGRSLREGAITQPFLAPEEIDERPLWFMYALANGVIVQVVTIQEGVPRSWRTLDGAIGDLRRELPDFPPVEVHSSQMSVGEG